MTNRPSVPQPPLRVLLIAPRIEDFVGGQAVQASRLMEGLKSEPHVSVTLQPILPKIPGPFGLFQRVKYIRTVVTVLYFCIQLLVRVPRHDVVHAFTSSFTGFLWWPLPAILVARLFGKPSVLNYRDGRAEAHLSEWPSSRRLIPLATAVAPNTPYLVDVFARFGIEARAVFNLIESDRFIWRDRPKPEPRFLHNRGLELVYNVPCTLRAFELVQRRYPAATLTLAHDGPLRGELEVLVDELGLKNVSFVGRVPMDEIPELLDRSDIYLTSPRQDCMPGSLLECFASGLPVIATAVGGIPYILDHGRTGLLVPDDDAEAMAEAAFRLLEEDGLATRIAHAAREELEQYRWTNVRRQWLGLYQELTHRTDLLEPDSGARPAASRPPARAQA